MRAHVVKCIDRTTTRYQYNRVPQIEGRISLSEIRRLKGTDAVLELSFTANIKEAEKDIICKRWEYLGIEIKRVKFKRQGTEDYCEEFEKLWASIIKGAKYSSTKKMAYKLYEKMREL